MNFQQMCRICIGEKSEMTSIFQSCNFSAHKSEIFEVITDCASVQIQKFDGFSELICPGCLHHLSQAYSFKKLCEDSDYKFRNGLMEIDKIQIKEEISIEDTAIIYGDNYITESMDEIAKIIKVKEEQSNDEIQTIDVKEEDAAPTENKFGCDICAIKFSQKKSLSAHIRWHRRNLQMQHKRVQAEVKQHKCNICNKVFTSNSGLVLHKKMHIAEKSNQCNVCSKMFLRSPDLKRHLEVHTGEKRHNCHICNKKFATKKYLVDHMRWHTKEKNHKCDICDKKFLKLSNLTWHLRTHTGEKLYKCNICEKKFANKNYLLFHIRLHTEERKYKCDICEKKFLTNSNLKQHLLCHSGEKQFKCDVCDKRFLINSHLNEHIQTHARTKYYKCEICDKSFTRNHNLKSHLQKVHTEENKD